MELDSREGVRINLYSNWKIYYLDEKAKIERSWNFDDVSFVFSRVLFIFQEEFIWINLKFVE